MEEILRKYRRLWNLKYYLPLHNLTPDQIKGRPDVEKELNLATWKTLVWNENTEERDQQLLNIRELREKIELLIPHWIMDRLKEALDQYVNGQWFSSILLCGAIVDFLRKTLNEAYRQEIPKGETPQNGVRGNLTQLRDWGILKQEDFDRLIEVRQSRDDYTHLKMLKQDAQSLKQDNFKALNKLFDFFKEENMSPKYEKYLLYLYKYSRPKGENREV